MAELSFEAKCELAAKLIRQSPPGEVNDVINDIRAIIANDDQLMPFILPALRAYNLEQLHVVEHPSVDDCLAHTSLLSSSAILPGSSFGAERYIDAIGKSTFAFDHVTLQTSDFEPYNLPEEEEAFRAELAKSLAAYTKNHFPSGHSSVNCSQHPLLPPHSGPPVLGTFNEPVQSILSPTEETPEKEQEPIGGDGIKADEVITDIPEEPITDVVEEQIAAGDAEPVPTPAVGELEEKKEEVSMPGGLEKVDELVQEVKIEEEGKGGAEQPEPTVGESALDEPKVEEIPAATAESSDSAKDEAPSPAQTSVAEERKHERVENPIYTLEIVGNKYNTSNFWTGRWRTRWTVDKSAGTVSGDINVDVHYYEQGNVQLATHHTSSFPYPSSTESQSVASQVVTTISKIETNYHLELNDVYGDLGDKAFKALRRALPVTRQKMEWEKVSGYTLGSDLTKARA